LAPQELAVLRAVARTRPWCCICPIPAADKLGRA
jgi:hypothetical protein